MERGFQELIEIIKALRGPKGCPWDKAQTLGTAKDYVLEEAFELLDAVEQTDSDHMCEEAGDLLFQVLFLINLAEEEGLFKFEDVTQKAKAKMIRRHPHVFGNRSVEDVGDVLRVWEEVKKEEKKDGKSENGLPASMPGSMQLAKISKILKRKAVNVDPSIFLHYLSTFLKRSVKEADLMDDQQATKLLKLVILYMFFKGFNIDELLKKLAKNLENQLTFLPNQQKNLNLDELLNL